jgi:hypothetical protein
MKKPFIIYLFTACVLFSMPSFGRFVAISNFYQDSTKPALNFKSNILKINVASLVFKNISFQYERK